MVVYTSTCNRRSIIFSAKFRRLTPLEWMSRTMWSIVPNQLQVSSENDIQNFFFAYFVNILLDLDSWRSFTRKIYFLECIPWKGYVCLCRLKTLPCNFHVQFHISCMQLKVLFNQLNVWHGNVSRSCWRRLAHSTHNNRKSQQAVHRIHDSCNLPYPLLRTNDSVHVCM